MNQHGLTAFAQPIVTILLSFSLYLSSGVGGSGPGSAHSQQVQQSGGAHPGERRTQIVGSHCLS